MNTFTNRHRVSLLLFIKGIDNPTQVSDGRPVSPDIVINSLGQTPFHGRRRLTVEVSVRGRPGRFDRETVADK